MLTCRDQQAAAYKGSRKINRPATHPIHFATDSPDKIIAAPHGRYFSFMGNAPRKFHEPTECDTDFPSTPQHKQGQELRLEQTVTPLHQQMPLHHRTILLNI